MSGVRPAGGGRQPVGQSVSRSVGRRRHRAHRREIPFGYRLAWVPAGFAERVRQVLDEEPGDTYGPALLRMWKKNAGAGDPWVGAGISFHDLEINRIVLGR